MTAPRPQGLLSFDSKEWYQSFPLLWTQDEEKLEDLFTPLPPQLNPSHCNRGPVNCVNNIKIKIKN